MGCHDEPYEYDITIDSDRAFDPAQLKKELDKLQAKADALKAAENFEQFKDGLGDYSEENKRANEGYNSNEVKYDAPDSEDTESDWQNGFNEGYMLGCEDTRAEVAVTIMKAILDG